MANTMPRPFRVPDDVYAAALEKARAEGRTLTDVVVKALKAYIRRPPTQGGP